MHDLFFDATLQMMDFSEETGLERTIECQEFNVCKVVYPQPNDSWAAQRLFHIKVSGVGSTNSRLFTSRTHCCPVN